MRRRQSFTNYQRSNGLPFSPVARSSDADEHPVFDGICIQRLQRLTQHLARVLPSPWLILLLFVGLASGGFLQQARANLVLSTQQSSLWQQLPQNPRPF